ncbi:speckle-type POZ protein B-like [Microplitis mediator]|uniref:speckle-type POZ protein B-like n=1 Tax=Microplitis mediator TaxID=375433 RepID=UPI002555F305|nr:speckle-type POZ protein B-like [Microplitis mediator]XP_057326790.1 speckle-type POZ protein B-like [Microplitis mediator]
MMESLTPHKIIIKSFSFELIQEEWKNSEKSILGDESTNLFEEFYISVFSNGLNDLKIRVIKTFTRSAIATIELQIENSKRIIKDIFDWKDVCDFGIISCPVKSMRVNSSRTCNPVLDCRFNVNLNISCKIIWYGFVDELNSSNLYEHTGNYLLNTEFSDIVIKVQDKKFPVHKIILASQSRVFEEMITNLMKDQENTICLPDIKVEVVDELLTFLYHGKLVKAIDDNDLLMELFETAEIYKIDALKDRCAMILSVNLNIDNVLRLLELSETYNSVVLKQRAITFIINNRDEIINLSEFKELCESNPALMFGIVERFKTILHSN